MQNLKNKYFISAALIIGAAFFYFNSQKNSSHDFNDESSKNDVEVETNLDAHHGDDHSAMTSQASAKVEEIVIHDENELSEFKDLSVKEKRSLLTLGALLQEAINPDSTLDSVVKKLEELKLKPTILKDSNPYTGDMDVVRTKETMPGTRYFHAQYFSKNGASADDPNRPQHISFELRPGKDSFLAAKKMIVTQFKITGKPSRESENFTSWSIPGRTVWVKRLQKEDLVDPFNSYDPKTDVGVVRIATEFEVH